MAAAKRCLAARLPARSPQQRRPCYRCSLTVLLWRRRSVTLHQTPRGVPKMQTLTAALPIVHIIDELKAGRVVVTYVQDQAAVGARDRFRGHWVVLAEHARDTQDPGLSPSPFFGRTPHCGELLQPYVAHPQNTSNQTNGWALCHRTRQGRTLQMRYSTIEMLARVPSTAITTRSMTNRGEGIASPTFDSSRATQGSHHNPRASLLSNTGLPTSRLQATLRAGNSPRLASRGGESVQDSQLLGMLHSKLPIRAPAHAAA